jgi:hypothetical protein
MKGGPQPISPRESIPRVVNLIEDDTRVIGKLSKEPWLLRHLLIGHHESIVVTTQDPFAVRERTIKVKIHVRRGACPLNLKVRCRNDDTDPGRSPLSELVHRKYQGCGCFSRSRGRLD